MPRYFFDIHDGDGPRVDKVGLVLPDDEAARSEATRAITELGEEILPDDGARRRLAISVRAEDGTPLFQVRIHFAFEKAVNRA